MHCLHRVLRPGPGLPDTPQASGVACQSGLGAWVGFRESCVHAQVECALSWVRGFYGVFVALWIVACQAPLLMGFSRHREPPRDIWSFLRRRDTALCSISQRHPWPQKEKDPSHLGGICGMLDPWGFVCSDLDCQQAGGNPATGSESDSAPASSFGNILVTDAL